MSRWPTRVVSIALIPAALAAQQTQPIYKARVQLIEVDVQVTDPVSAVPIATEAGRMALSARIPLTDVPRGDYLLNIEARTTRHTVTARCLSASSDCGSARVITGTGDEHDS